jgi:hypothetical protein
MKRMLIADPRALSAKYRLLSYSIHRHLLDPARLPPLLRSLRAALFPNNAPGHSTMVAPASDEELLALRRRCASALWGLAPGPLGRLIFGAKALPSATRLAGQCLRGPDRQAMANLAPRASDDLDVAPGNSSSDMDDDGDNDGDEARILAEIEVGLVGLFADGYCNKHLMYSAVELVLVRLMPELSANGVVDLWEDRLS